MRLLPTTVAGIVLVSILGAFSARAQTQGHVEENVVYGMVSGLALLMDVVHPTEPNGYGVVVIPGSGWHTPTDLDAEPLKNSWRRPALRAESLLEAGYTLFAINHRAAPVFRYPAAVEDAQRAVRYVRANAERFGIDPDRIGAIGGSSGGHLVSMLGTLDAGAQGTGINAKSSKAQAVVALFPTTDFQLYLRTGSGGAGAAAASFLGIPGGFAFPGAEALYREASPITHVSEDDAPFLLIHGDQDRVVNLDQSETFLEALRNVGVESELIVVRGGTHGDRILNGSNAPDYFEPLVNWFDTHLKSR